MHFDIQYRPAHSLAKVSLDPNESVVAESGAMVGKSTNVQMQTQSGGLMSGLKRMFGGESFFRNTFTAANGPGEVLLAQGDRSGALAAFRAALAIREKLAAQDPSNATWQRNLAELRETVATCCR